MPIFRRMKHWGAIIPILLLSSLLFTACGGNSPTILNPTGPVAVQEANLFWFILAVATLVFVVVEAVLIWSIIRYRERPNTPAPRQIHGNNTIEIIWTVAPSLFLFAVLTGTIYTMFNLTNISSTNGSIPERRFIAGGVLIASEGHNWANEPACQIVNGKLANKDNCGLYQWLHDPQA